MGDSVDYGALFGVTADTGAGANEQGSADPAGSKNDAAAEPAAEGTEGTEESEKTEEQVGSEDGGEGKPAGQSAEENSRYAAARRKAEAERDLAVQKAREEVRIEMQKQLDESIAKIGMQNPYTKKPIVSMADLAEYQQKLDVDKKSRIAKRAGMTEGEFDKYVEELPVVKSAKEQMARAEEAQKAAAAKEAEAEINRQIAEIGEMDPSIKSIDDLRKMTNYQDFYALVKRGNTLTDAYKLVNFERLTSSSAAQAKQAALNQVASKAHLDRTVTRGAGAVQVPADVIAEYRMFNPDATDAEIRAHWAKYKK